MNGSHNSEPALSGNFMRSGITPMMVAGWPLTRRVRPMHVRIEIEAVLPDLVADDDDRLGAAPFVGGDEGAAEDRRLSQHVEMVGRDPGALRLLGRRMVVADVDRAERVGGDAGERLRLRAPVLEIATLTPGA